MVTALGDRAEVHLDGGIMNGGIVTKAAFGARTCPVGRACCTGSRPAVNGGGTARRRHSRQQVQRTLRRLGVTSLAELALNRVRLGWVRLWCQGKIAL